MLKKGLYFAVLLILLFSKLEAQNLVPNSSFEGYTVCPNSPGEIFRSWYWFQPHKYPGGSSVNQSSSSDYYNSCSSFIGTAIPINSLGFQNAKTGNAYIGLGLFAPFNNGNDYREYVEVKLIKDLEPNKKYVLKYFISMAEGSAYSITRFDAHLSNDSLLHTSMNLSKIPVTPLFQYNGRIDDSLSWVEVSGSFIAAGDERFLTIGNFHDVSLCDTIGIPINLTSFCCAYYYIDDVSLEEDTITGISELFKVNFTIYPIPVKGTMQLNSQHIIQEVNIMDIRRKSIMQQKPLMESVTIDVSQLDAGVYIVQCKFKNGEVVHKKVVFQH